ncbi:immunity 26/phosphotriesterase HocA family protein [Acinetobacter sp. AOR15_HL]|uniref:Imm26 family immunity protein n=1 Tax=unclassified Acinetobacter TaxID=196816 RepID=UPI0022EAEECA|nr:MULTISPECIES: Imm26 family immunity protein [unclassified Acinetobacter]MDA3559550.1 immunity 26/phosphotriesterase HocA family protein [Acinetobacter sp. AOR15_HL]MDA3573887.1 immunity 26/phosphotriesterase HocA family protein [Acinetobacter sp. AOR14_HL]
MKKQRFKEGALLQIDLKNGQYAFGWVVNKEETLFYDFFTDNISSLNLDKIYSAKELFRVAVMKYAITSAQWTVIDNKPIEADLAIPNKYFMQDVITKEFSIYYQGNILPATYEEIKDLECAAVWEPEHVEDRLRDYFAGVPNVWVEDLKPKP